MDENGGFLGALSRGWTGPNMLGAGMGLAGLLGSLFSQPRYERLDRSPEQRAGLNRATELATAPPPQYSEPQIEADARLAAMEGAGKAASRGFQVPGGGMIGMPQTISSEEALRRVMQARTANLGFQQGGQQTNLNAAQNLISGGGYSYRQRPSVFGQAMQAGQGFGTMIPQPMGWQQQPNRMATQRPFAPNLEYGPDYFS